jgi:hypothetical protein
MDSLRKSLPYLPLQNERVREWLEKTFKKGEEMD